MRWHRSHRFDHRALPLADRHYSRQKAGTPQFVAPGRNLVLLTQSADALWVSLDQKHATHAWPGAWICSLFRNEGCHLSSEMIREAVAATRAQWGDPPRQGFLTFVDPEAVRSQNPGYCFKVAGWETVGNTRKRCLLALRLAPEDFPPSHRALPFLALSGQGFMFGTEDS